MLLQWLKLTLESALKRRRKQRSRQSVISVRGRCQLAGGCIGIGIGWHPVPAYIGRRSA